VAFASLTTGKRYQKFTITRHSSHDTHLGSIPVNNT